METNRAKEFLRDVAGKIAMPKIYLKLRHIIEKPDNQISDFVSLLKTDPILTARLIRAANSPFFGIPNQATGLHEAISVIGIRQLHDVVLSILFMRAFASIPDQTIDPKTYWQYGVKCGIAARTIAQRCDVIESNHYFSLGLMHGVGQALMYLKNPKVCLQLRGMSKNQSHLLAHLERQKLGFDYAQLGKEIMHLWYLPESYQQVAAYHLDPAKADMFFREEVLVIHLAHIICQTKNTDSNQALIKKIIENNYRLSKLPVSIDRIVMEKLNIHTKTVLNILWPNSASTAPKLRLVVNR